ncbi:glutaminyl-tRNA synthase (glutamine-hydrolyzing) subunit A [Microgenomates group bacterium RIFCSPLOWO2_01_FULL_47_10]|nr:MAG: glutaminyl-tRNA synthase (glutamine-hydrolyzing) subunit A [Microgenomates group bacterium RIFCSPLOWO2_01_FULL_47_10]
MKLKHTFAESVTLLQNKELSAVELAGLALDQAESTNSALNAFITIDRKTALDQAKTADQRRASGEIVSSLCGLPYVMKDVYVTKDVTTTAGSQVLAGYIPPYSATVYEKLQQSGAVLIGKNNQDAWGHGGSSENNDFGPVKNPWNESRVAGGSSGGTAAALAVGAGLFGIAEDTGGSIRNPASFCNLTGLKVTYGRVSRYGAIAYASSFDTVGPMARSAQDCAAVMEAIAGFDSLDASSSHEAVPFYQRELTQSLRGKVIGIPKEFFTDALNPQVKTIVNASLRQLEQLGMKLTEISLPTVKYGHAIYYVLVFAETSSNLGRYDAVRFGADRSHFTDETIRRIITGTFGLSSGYYDAYYKKAMQGRSVLIQEFAEAYQKVDVIASPVMPFPAYPIGGIESQFKPEDVDLAMYLADIYTCPANTVGVPAISIPAGFTKQHLPVGLQLHGKMFAESTLLAIAHQYQSVTNWHQESPRL